MLSHFSLSALALALAGITAALPAQTLDERGISDRYVSYTGNGGNWPSKNAWGDYGALWNANVPIMQRSCGWNGWGADNSGAEINAINNGIDSVSRSTGVDKRFILAVIMQESNGCVRVPTTNNGVRNPGLMQSHNGSGSCAGVNPCPAGTITQMIRDGVAGTSSGDGLRQTLARTKGVVGDNSRAVYAAARMYNSGSVDYNNLNNGLGSTPCYASDVANRLTGWTLAPRQCRA
ncbi:hypothetical protein NOR_03842 [Metarhizium rileyi]|uniref:Glycoside hydrolase n=1 Tax=Metarhizium rileyi (strain RCEF 4871) TaxID=1649241 RepID=A0A167ELH2_METRR|nr:hypothetical protein NOR_03842 [Metarhizium rileyi RCEF 4871]